MCKCLCGSVRINFENSIICTGTRVLSLVPDTVDFSFIISHDICSFVLVGRSVWHSTGRICFFLRYLCVCVLFFF
jgi:hypothetical protein